MLSHVSSGVPRTQARDKCGDTGDLLASNSRRPTQGTWECARLVRYATPAAERRARWEADAARKARMQQIAQQRALAPPPRNPQERPGSGSGSGGGGTSSRPGSAPPGGGADGLSPTGSAASGGSALSPAAAAGGSSRSAAGWLANRDPPERAVSAGGAQRRAGLPHSTSTPSAAAAARLPSAASASASAAAGISRPSSLNALPPLRTAAGATAHAPADPGTPSDAAATPQSARADTPLSPLSAGSIVAAQRTDSTCSLPARLLASGETPRAAMEARQRAEAEAKKQAEAKRLAEEQAKRAAGQRAKETARAAAKAMAVRAAQLGKGDEPAPAGWLRVDSQPNLRAAGGSGNGSSRSGGGGGGSPARRSDDPMLASQRPGHRRTLSSDSTGARDREKDKPDVEAPATASRAQHDSGAPQQALPIRACALSPITPAPDSPSSQAAAASSPTAAASLDDAYAQERLRREAASRGDRSRDRRERVGGVVVGVVRAAVGAASASGVPFIGAADILLSAAAEAYRLCVANGENCKLLLERMKLLRPAMGLLADHLDSGARLM